jgi:hypothetical protein
LNTNKPLPRREAYDYLNGKSTPTPEGEEKNNDEGTVVERGGITAEERRRRFRR